MRLKKAFSALVMSAIGIGVSISLVAPAHAIDWDHTLWTADDHPGGRLQWARDGDVVKVCDTYVDGYSAFAEVSSHANGREYTISASGDGECKSRTAASYNLVEGRKYHFKVCLVKDGIRVFCQQRDWTN